MIISIQLLRFFAASFVVLTHIRGEYNLIQFGSFGLDIFFVISGFIISVITKENIDWFFVRRLIRIVPLYWFFTIIISLVAYFYPALLRTSEFNIPHIISSLFFFPYWTENSGFKPILNLGWTLNYEIFFYILFYISMKINHLFREIICSFIILSIVISNYLFAFQDYSVLIFYSDSILLEFIFGMLIGCIYNFKKSLLLEWRMGVSALLFVIGSACLYLLILTNIFENNMRLPRFIYHGIPASLIFLSFITFEHKFKSLSSIQIKIFNRFGDISFSMYLVHMYIIVIFSRITNLTFVDITIYFLIMMLITSVISYITFKYFEKPVRNLFTNKLVTTS